MERLFTNITNEELTQNNNDLHTGCYAGEREDFMMNGIYMTENGLKAENAPVKIVHSAERSVHRCVLERPPCGAKRPPV